MKRSKSSSRWLNEHVNDPYVKRAQKDGYRSRASYKLLELNEKDKVITIFADSDFQLDQVKTILFPEMEKKEPDCVKRLDQQAVQKVSGDKVKQDLKIKIGIESELAKKIVKLIKDSKLKVQAALQDQQVRVTGKSRDDLQTAIAMVKKGGFDLPLQFTNFRD